MAAPGAPGFVRIGGPPGGGGARSAKIPGSAGEPRRAGRVPRVGTPNRRVAGAVRALHGPPVPQPKARAAGPAKSTPYVHSLGLLYGFSAPEGRGVEQLLNSSEQARNKAELEPLQQKGREIQNTERTVGQRYGAATNQMNQLLSGLTGQAEGSAKTFENTAAENAMATTRSVETAGQNATTATGGYINPELRSILQSTGTAAQNLAQGGVNRANELGQANTNYMRQLAAAAAIGAGTGPGGGLANIANRYQTQAGQNRAAENQVLARGAARNKEERLTFPKELQTLRLAKGKLEQAGELGRGRIEATNRATATRAATTTRGQNLTSAAAAARNATTQRGQNLTHSASEKRTEAMINHWAEQTAAKAGPGGGKPLPSAQRNKFISQLARSFELTRRYRSLGAKSPNEATIRSALERGEHTEEYKSGGKTKTRVVKEGGRDPAIVKAAVEMWWNQKLSPQTRQALQSRGFELPPDSQLFEMLTGKAAPPPANPALKGITGGVQA